MVIIKVISNITLARKQLESNNYLKNALKYMKYDKENVRIHNNEIVYDIREDLRYIHGVGVNYYDFDLAFKQMMKMKLVHNKENYNPCIHIVINSDNYSKLEEWKRFGLMIENYFRGNYQIIWAIHESIGTSGRLKDCVTYHIHIVINPVNIVDGKLIAIKRTWVCSLVDYIHKLNGLYVEAYTENSGTGKVMRLVGKRNN